MPIPVAERSEARLCRRLLSEIVGPNISRGTDVCLLWVLCVLPYRGLCDRPITRPEKSYRMRCVSVCDLETSKEEAALASVGLCFQIGILLRCDARHQIPRKRSRLLNCTIWFKYDRDKLWLVYTQIVPVIFEPPCIFQPVFLNRLTGFIEIQNILPYKVTPKIYF
jgi:hypothetical protein